MLREHRAKILVLLLAACGLAVSAILWQYNTRTATSTLGHGDVFTKANDANACMEQARAFGDYPLVFAGPSVLGYPLVYCDHMRTITRYDEKGRISHPGGDSWSFGYGTCTTPEGRESCALPVTIRIDPCALTVDGRTIPRGSHPVRSMPVRGAPALVGDHGISFEQSPQIISISASASSSDADKQVANAVAVAEALIPANALASALARGASLTTAFAASPDALCRNSFAPAPAVTAEPSPASTVTPAAAATPPASTLQLDMDPATPGVQSSLTISGAQDINIDVVLDGKVGNVSAFNFTLIYDDTLFSDGTQVTLAVASGGGLDGNPDFNQTALGTAWNCASGGSPSPDVDPATGAGHGAALLSCYALAGGTTLTAPAVIATLRLHAPAAVAASIELADVSFAHDDTTEIGSCNPTITVEMTCAGGSLVTQ